MMCLLAGAFLLTLQQDWGEKDAPDHQAPGVPWCVSSCPKSGFGLLLWLTDVRATNGPAALTRNAALSAVTPRTVVVILGRQTRRNIEGISLRKGLPSGPTPPGLYENRCCAIKLGRWGAEFCFS